MSLNDLLQCLIGLLLLAVLVCGKILVDLWLTDCVTLYLGRRKVEELLRAHETTSEEIRAAVLALSLVSSQFSSSLSDSPSTSDPLSSSPESPPSRPGEPAMANVSSIGLNVSEFHTGYSVAVDVHLDAAAPYPNGQNVPVTWKSGDPSQTVTPPDAGLGNLPTSVFVQPGQTSGAAGGYLGTTSPGVGTPAHAEAGGKQTTHVLWAD